MRYELIIPGPTFARLQTLLFDGEFTGRPSDQFEHQCLCLCGLVRGPGRTRLLLREIVTPEPGECERSAGSVRLSHGYQQRVRTICRDNHLCVLDIHTHPFGAGFFSGADAARLETMGYWSATAWPDAAMVMMVHGATSLACRYYDVRHPIPVGPLTELRIVGRRWERYRLDASGTAAWDTGPAAESAEHPGSSPSAHHRQMLCWGAQGQQELESLHVAILGVGGLGSLAAETFARLGVRELTLVDMDVVSRSNLSRLAGAYPPNPFDVGSVGQSKVEVVARHAKRVNPSLVIHTHEAPFEDASVESAIAFADLLYVGVDTFESRMNAHVLGARYLIPVVEGGTTIRADVGHVEHMISAFRLFVPGTNGCHHCLGERPARVTGPALMGPKGYVFGTDLSPVPAVLPLNSVINAIACHQTTKYVTGFADPVDGLRYDALKETLQIVRYPVNPDCPVCSASQRLALGQSGTLGNLEALFRELGYTEEDHRQAAEIADQAEQGCSAARDAQTAYRHSQT